MSNVAGMIGRGLEAYGSLFQYSTFVRVNTYLAVSLALVTNLVELFVVDFTYYRVAETLLLPWLLAILAMMFGVAVFFVIYIVEIAWTTWKSNPSEFKQSVSEVVMITAATGCISLAFYFSWKLLVIVNPTLGKAK